MTNRDDKDRGQRVDVKRPLVGADPDVAAKTAVLISIYTTEDEDV